MGLMMLGGRTPVQRSMSRQAVLMQAMHWRRCRRWSMTGSVRIDRPADYIKITLCGSLPRLLPGCYRGCRKRNFSTINQTFLRITMSSSSDYVVADHLTGRLGSQGNRNGRGGNARPDGDARGVWAKPTAQGCPHRRQPAHDHPDGRSDRDAGGAGRRGALGVLQHLFDPGPCGGSNRARPGFRCSPRKGETLEEYWDYCDRILDWGMARRPT